MAAATYVDYHYELEEKPSMGGALEESRVVRPGENAVNSYF